MITGIKITKVEANRISDNEVAGLNINIGVDRVTVKGGDVTIEFNYAATYMEGVGDLKMAGVLTSKEDPKLAKEINDRWTKEKKLPDAYAELVLNAVNYACGTNGTLVVRAVNLSPPIVPPRIQIGPQQPPASGRMQ